MCTSLGPAMVTVVGISIPIHKIVSIGHLKLAAFRAEHIRRITAAAAGRHTYPIVMSPLQIMEGTGRVVNSHSDIR